MTDIVLPYSGVTVATQSAPQRFDWSSDTKAQEYLSFYKYCVDHNLLTIIGEQSRKALQKKVFNHLGGVGDSADAATIHWLQDQTGSGSTSVEALWLAYFEQHRTTPDSEGLTYGDLSVESGYRRWLRQYLGFSSIFNDYPVLQDKIKLFLKKNFSDDVTLTDALAHVLTPIDGYLSTATVESFAFITQSKKFADTVNLTDSAYIKQSKVASDKVSVIDAYDLVGINLEGYFETVGLSDKYQLHMTKAFSSSAAPEDAAMLKQVKVISDSISLTDSISLEVGIFESPVDRVFIEEVVLILLKKAYSDNITVSDTMIHGFASFGAGEFGAYYMGV